MVWSAPLGCNAVLGFRAANNGWSTDNVRSELGFDLTNPWIPGHFFRSFTDLLRKMLIFNCCKSYDC